MGTLIPLLYATLPACRAITIWGRASTTAFKPDEVQDILARHT